MSSLRNASSKPAISSSVAVSVGRPDAATSTRFASPTADADAAAMSCDGLAGSGQERLPVLEAPQYEPSGHRLVDADAGAPCRSALALVRPDDARQAHGAAEPRG